MRTVGFPPIPVLSLSTFVDLLKIQGSDRNNSILPKLSISSSSSPLLCETELLVASPSQPKNKKKNKLNCPSLHIPLISSLSMKRPFSNSKPIPEDIGLSSIQCDDKFALTSDLEAELDEDQSINETIGLTAGEKKRRLGLDQVRALERHFEVENKLDPDRKTKLAQELGLQPRQVAIWFQNRRARSKTKQLERDFNELKSRHDDILIECESLRRDRDALSAQIKELQSKLDKSQAKAVKLEMSASMFYRDGASDSDSSVVFNEESIDQQCFIDTYTANFPCKGFLEETFAIPSEEQELGAGTGFFSDEPVSDPSPWYGSDEWVD